MSLLPGVNTLARDYDSGRSTPEEAVSELLATIDRLDSTIEAWQALYTDDAIDAALAATKARAAGHRIGPFHGIPFALKDIVDVQGRVTTAGSKAWASRLSPSTALIARRLLAAGGVLLGKTKTVEFALGGWGTNQHMGTPRNPWDAENARVPGGSSSGSGAAVASGMTPCAIGTDTGGSVRLPAALCGIVGLKTTEGLIPTDGIVPLSHTLDTPGPMARSVADATLMFDVLTGRDQSSIDDDWRQGTGLYASLRKGVAGLHLGVLGDAERALVEPNVLADYDRAVETLTALGARTSTFIPPRPFDEMKDQPFVIVTAEAYYHHQSLYDDRSAPLDEFCRARGLPGADVSARDYVAAQLRRGEEQASFQHAFDSFDAMLTPGTPMVAPTHAEVDEDITPAHFTRAGNYLGLCGLCVPAGLAATSGPSGTAPVVLPTSLQIFGRPFDESMVLRIGAAFEEARGDLGVPPLS